MQFLLFLLALHAASASEEQTFEQVNTQVALSCANGTIETKEPPLDTLFALSSGRHAHASSQVPLLHTYAPVAIHDIVSGLSENFEHYVEVGMDVFGNVPFVQMVLDSMGFQDIMLAFSKHVECAAYDRFVLTTIAEFGFDVAKKCGFGLFIDEFGIESWFGNSDPVGPIDTKHVVLLALAKEQCPEFIKYVTTNITAKDSNEILKYITDFDSAKLDVPEVATRSTPEQLIALMPQRGKWNDKQYALLSMVAKNQESNHFIVAAAAAKRGDVMAFLLLGYRQDLAAEILQRDWTTAGINLPLEYSRIPFDFLAPYNNLKIVKLLYDAKYHTRAKNYFEQYAISQPNKSATRVIISAGTYGSVDMVCSSAIVHHFGLTKLTSGLVATASRLHFDSALKEGCIVALAKLYVHVKSRSKEHANDKVSALFERLDKKYFSNPLWIETVYAANFYYGL